MAVNEIVAVSLILLILGAGGPLVHWMVESAGRGQWGPAHFLGLSPPDATERGRARPVGGRAATQFVRPLAILLPVIAVAGLVVALATQSWAWALLLICAGPLGYRLVESAGRGTWDPMRILGLKPRPATEPDSEWRAGYRAATAITRPLVILQPLIAIAGLGVLLTTRSEAWVIPLICAGTVPLLIILCAAGIRARAAARRAG